MGHRRRQLGLPWGPQDDNASIAAIHKAIDLGVNWIDKRLHGLGHSETIVGQAVKQSSVKPFVFTKSGMVWDDKRGIRRTLLEIRREVEDSCAAATGCHRPLPDPLAGGGPGHRGMDRDGQLQHGGKVRHIGVSNFSVAQMERCLKIAPIASLQPPYSLLNRAVEAEVLPSAWTAASVSSTTRPRSPACSTGAMTKERVAAAGGRLPAQRKAVSGASTDPQSGPRPCCGRSVRAVRLGRRSRHYVALANPAVTAAIVGARSPQQVEGVWPAAKYRLTEEEMQEIQSFMDDKPPFFMVIARRG